MNETLISTGEYWAKTGLALENYYTQKLTSGRYLNAFSIVSDKSPLDGLTPHHEKFYGPKVCVLFIIGLPYGEKKVGDNWTIDWPPEGFKEQKETIKRLYNQWANYEIHFYGDGILLDKAASNSSTGKDVFIGLLTSVFSKIEAECLEMKEFGWKWEGIIKNEVEASHFYPVVNAFMNKELIKAPA